jgi:hypothetical protein
MLYQHLFSDLNDAFALGAGEMLRFAIRALDENTGDACTREAEDVRFDGGNVEFFGAGFEEEDSGDV